ncbi:unnamed protein product [Acanthoscelides obtectus]|uniref:Uncharacterized protein n=1 Tax=Acanthoscelides obtectus TaxID=200917 RepID=A0A9P0LWL3_ACAOB|nr:unnamed protein product [Acanthoscelides obtectus]CAK1641224.1 hypothetical protein AOBTE_LOCUS12252 [Acanthoscelides obtectus]
MPKILTPFKDRNLQIPFKIHLCDDSLQTNNFTIRNFTNSHNDLTSQLARLTSDQIILIINFKDKDKDQILSLKN